MLGLAPAGAPPAPADLVIVDAHVWTVDDARPEAEAVAVRGERIVLVGTSDEELPSGVSAKLDQLKEAQRAVKALEEELAAAAAGPR